MADGCIAVASISILTARSRPMCAEAPMWTLSQMLGYLLARFAGLFCWGLKLQAYVPSLRASGSFVAAVHHVREAFTDQLAWQLPLHLRIQHIFAVPS